LFQPQPDDLIHEIQPLERWLPLPANESTATRLMFAFAIESVEPAIQTIISSINSIGHLVPPCCLMEQRYNAAYSMSSKKSDYLLLVNVMLGECFEIVTI
jgi:hypothetical protein